MRRSRLILSFLLVTHIAALCLLYLLAINLVLTGFSGLLIIVSLLFYCHRYGWLFKPMLIKHLWINQDGFWFWSDSDDREQGPMQLRRSVMLGPLIAVYLKPASARCNRSLIIARDNVTDEDWRRLRIKLRDPESWG
ncbi:MAG: hypothetical protein HUJ23_10030 [Methylophaga sp.]|nr:hypothetical protein [Methylophaga sp.]